MLTLASPAAAINTTAPASPRASRAAFAASCTHTHLQHMEWGVAGCILACSQGVQWVLPCKPLGVFVGLMDG